jgi:hypothetical protein
MASTMTAMTPITSFFISNVSLPQDKFEEIARMEFGKFATIDRIDYATKERDAGHKQTMAFVHISNINEASADYRSMLVAIEKSGYCDIVIGCRADKTPRARPGSKVDVYMRVRENKTPIPAATMNPDQTAHLASENAGKIAALETQVDELKTVVAALMARLDAHEKDYTISMKNISEDVDDHHEQLRDLRGQVGI